MKMTSNVFLLPLCILFVLYGKNFAQQQCKQPFNALDEWPKTTFDYVITHNISASKPVQSCYDILENYESTAKDNVTFVYTIDGVVVRRHIKPTFNPDNIVTFTFDDNPSQVVFYRGELDPNGVIVFYVCQGDTQEILVGYVNTKDLSKEADEKAKGLTPTPDDFKLSREGCAPAARRR